MAGSIESQTDETEEFYRAFHDIVRMYQFRDVDGTCELGITITECHTLEIIALAGPLSVNDIVSRIHLNKSTVSRAVQSLVDKGLAKRGTDPSDARALRIEVTSSGRKLHRSIFRTGVDCYDSVLQSYDRKTRRAVVEILKALAVKIGCHDDRCDSTCA